MPHSEYPYHLRVFKAHPVYEGQPNPNLLIRAVDPMPDTRRDEDPTDALFRNRRLFEDEGKKIANALHDTLPGGTFDQVLRFMLEIKASHFIVSFKKEQP